MNPNPFAALIHSRKFWLLILDTVVSGATYFITKYAAPDFVKDALFFIGLMQPVFVALIAAITSEDNSQRKLEGERVAYAYFRDEGNGTAKVVEESESDGAG